MPEFDIVFHDVSSFGTGNLILPFVLSSDPKSSAVYFEVGNLRRRHFVVHAHLVKEKRLTNIANIFIAVAKVEQDIRIIEVHLFSLSKCAKSARICSKLGYHASLLHI